MKILRLFFLTLTISSLFAGLDEDLIEAAKNGGTKEVEELLDRGANIHARDDHALRWAAGSGHTDTARLLLDRGANIHARDDAPLRCAASNGHTDTARLLLDRGAHVHADDDCALRWAADDGHTDTARLLLDRGANIHACDDYALRRAVINGHTDTARLLLDRGAHVHADDDCALRWAARNGHHHAVTLLEACGLKGFEEFREDPLAFIEDQKNAARPVPPQLMLFWSIILNREETFDLLLNISLKTEDYADDKMEVEEPCDIANTIDKHHMTALMYAALFGNERMCAKLVHAGAKINLKNERGQEAIELAAGSGYWNTSSYLLMQLKGKNIF